MAWHQRHRLGLLQARLALADGDRDHAARLAADVASDAAGRGALRYVSLADAVVALAGGSDDLDAIAGTIDGLGRCAALEAWWLTAELGRRFAVDAWTRVAGQRAADLVRAAGPYATTLTARISAVLDSGVGQLTERGPDPARGQSRNSTERSRIGGSDPSSLIASCSSRRCDSGSSPAQESREVSHSEPPGHQLGRSELGESHRSALDPDLDQAGGLGRRADPLGGRHSRCGVGREAAHTTRPVPIPNGGPRRRRCA